MEKDSKNVKFLSKLLINIHHSFVICKIVMKIVLTLQGRAHFNHDITSYCTLFFYYPINYSSVFQLLSCTIYKILWLGHMVSVYRNSWCFVKMDYECSLYTIIFIMFLFPCPHCSGSIQLDKMYCSTDLHFCYNTTVRQYCSQQGA